MVELFNLGYAAGQGTQAGVTLDAFPEVVVDGLYETL
jgi:hypothetical protein